MKVVMTFLALHESKEKNGRIGREREREVFLLNLGLLRREFTLMLIVIAIGSKVNYRKTLRNLQ